MTTEIVPMGGALAIRPDQTAWTEAQVAVLRQSGINNQVTAAELSSFLHLCQRTQLDPFSRQIYLIGRWDGRAKREVFTPQTGIDGYRVIAHRVVAESKEAFGYEDTQWCDAAGRWRDVWLSSDPPAAAKVTVLRNGQRFSAVALYREYVQTNKDGKVIGLWGRMPAGQVAKCAEALALRKAFPHDLAGVYTAEEMAQADNPQPGEQAGQVRQLRRVQPGEPDQWQTPAPASAAEQAPKTAAEGRDYLHEAYQATDADTVRRIWTEARADGAVPEYLEQIAKVGREKAAAAAAPADEVVEGELVDEPSDDRTAAIDELRAAAIAAGIANSLQQDFADATGTDLADADTDTIRKFTDVIRSAA